MDIMIPSRVCRGKFQSSRREAGRLTRIPVINRGRFADSAFREGPDARPWAGVDR